MRTSIVLVATVVFGVLFWTDSPAQNMKGMGEREIQALLDHHNSDHSTTQLDGNRASMYLLRAVGNLTITKSASTDTYEVYFHVPIAFSEQTPILIEVESAELIDYKFLPLKDPNIIATARMNKAPTSNLDWTAWVLVRHKDYSDLPSVVRIPELHELPEEVKPWLRNTDCAQLDAKKVRKEAMAVRGNTENLMTLATDICLYCYNIPWQFPHYPIAFDAVYALKWGSSCTGHAHAGAALFRANGVPARTILNLPTSGGGFYDHHWIIDYYVPDYGWVRMETSTGQHPAFAKDEIVTFLCHPEDEFPLFYPSAIEGQWHTSDPVLGTHNPWWALAHNAYKDKLIIEYAVKADLAHELTQTVFSYYVQYFGIELPPGHDLLLQDAVKCQTDAIGYFQNGDLDGYISSMQAALKNYERIKPGPVTRILFENFETSPTGWSHGGFMDEWEWGIPTYGPKKAHSGQHCYGTDLDGDYENNADNWLQSPEIDLSEFTSAYMYFWVWNWVQDKNQGLVYDPLWLDITTDGQQYIPLCSEMGGVNDDPLIPDVGGWNRIVLDLTRYAGEKVRIRFRFKSNASNAQPGSYIDDVLIFGRK